jgi:chromosome segregation ATPase
MIKMDLIPALNITDVIAVFQHLDANPLIKKIEDEARALALGLDVSIPKDRKEFASLAHKVAKSKVFIDTARKDFVAEEKEKIKKIDQEGKKIRDRLDALKVEVRSPLTEFEEAEKARIEKERLEEEYALAWDEAHAEHDLFLRRKELERKEKELAEKEAARKAEEERVKAEEEKAEREARIKKEAARKAEEERVKAEEEKAEREARIKKEAAEAAKKEAEEKARQEKLRLERQVQEEKEKKEKAERDRIAAEERAKIEKENAIKEAERKAQEAIKAAEEKAKEEARQKEIAKQKEEAEKARKAANKAHQKAVNKGVYDSLVKQGVSEDMALKVVTLVANGKIQNLIIRY